MSQRMHIAQPDVQLSPVGTEGTPDPASGRDVLSVVQFEEEHSAWPRDHKVGHIVAQHSATPEPAKLSHGISPGLCSRCSSCPEKW